MNNTYQNSLNRAARPFSVEGSRTTKSNGVREESSSRAVPGKIMSGDKEMPTSERQLNDAVTSNNEIASRLATWPAGCDNDREELTASIAEAATSLADKSSSSSLTISSSKLGISVSKKRHNRLSYEWIVATMIVLLCNASFHQSSSVLAVAITDSAEVDFDGNHNAAAVMRMRGTTNGIQRKRSGARREHRGGVDQLKHPELSTLQFQRIANHRRLDREQFQQQGRQLVHEGGKRALSTSSSSLHQEQAAPFNTRTLQDQTMCTCSPQIFNVKVTLTSTDPCTTNDLLPNLGIENTLCLYSNPLEGVYPPPPPVDTVPTASPVAGTATSTTQPTEDGTNDPFKPPPPPDGPGYPTYSPTVTGAPFTNNPFPTYAPTQGDERMVKEPVSGSAQRDGSGGGGEPTFQPTHPWPTFSPTNIPTQDGHGDDDEGGGRGGGGGKPRGGGGRGGGWLQDDEDGMPQMLSSVSLDDDELIEPHHHRHHHHHAPLSNQEDENNGRSGRKLESIGMKRVINVDELVVVQQDVTRSGERKDDIAPKDEDGGSSSDADTDSNKKIDPPYFQPPAVVHQSTLDAWISIHPNDVFFKKHPELKSYQEEIYRLKHGLHSSSSKVESSASFITRSLQASGFMPTRLISAQFLEMDTSPNMQIINNDDQYINVTFPDPSNIVLQFSSISNLLNPAVPLSDQMEYVPGGAILILVGATANGEIVRNRMMWTYTMGCGLEDYTVLDGNVIGWAGFVSVMIDVTFLS